MCVCWRYGWGDGSGPVRMQSFLRTDGDGHVASVLEEITSALFNTIGSHLVSIKLLKRIYKTRHKKAFPD